MLGKPVLDELSNFFCYGNNSSFHSFHETQVSASMIGNVMLVIQDGGEHALLKAEVFVVKVDHPIPDSLIFTIGLNIPDGIKESNMFIIQLLDIDKERFIPNIRVGHDIMSAKEQLSSVGKVSVLDVLGQPVLGPVCHLSTEVIVLRVEEKNGNVYLLKFWPACLCV